MDAKLFIFTGLPGTGKTTLARRLAEWVGAAYLRVDTIEQGLRHLCNFEVQGEGYRLAYRLAEDNLRLGISVVTDSCNPWNLTRVEWRQVAADCGCPWVDIQVVCSDAAEHRRRVEERSSDIAGLRLPTWTEVCERQYDAWTDEHVVIDTAGQRPDRAFAQLLGCLGIPAG